MPRLVSRKTTLPPGGPSGDGRAVASGCDFSFISGMIDVRYQLRSVSIIDWKYLSETSGIGQRPDRSQAATRKVQLTMTSNESLYRQNKSPLAPITRRRLATLMTAVAVTLGCASALHLSGGVHGRSSPFDATHAGIAEAVIGIVLAGGAAAVVRFPQRARSIAVAAIGFATVGFVVGLNFTARGGHLPDVIYHVALLPVLLGSLVVLLRARP
jgi:hypothetical protein